MTTTEDTRRAAATEMYEALRRLVSDSASAHNELRHSRSHDGECAWQDSIEEGRAALAKAEGRA